MNSKGELAGCIQAPPHCWRQSSRQATARVGRQGAISAPETGILHQTVSRLPVANQVFLESYEVDIYQEGHGLRSAPQRRHMAHLRWRSCCAPRKQSGWDWGGDTTHCPPGESALTKHLVTCSAGTWEGHKTHTQLSLCLCGVPKNLNLSSSDLGSACKPGPALDSLPAEQPGA